MILGVGTNKYNLCFCFEFEFALCKKQWYRRLRKITKVSQRNHTQVICSTWPEIQIVCYDVWNG